MSDSKPAKKPGQKPNESKKTTLRDIARICNVSTMAVSLAINGKGGVSKQTEEKIWNAVRKLNYTPNMIAKSLRVQSTKTIGVLMSDSSHLLFTKLLRDIGDSAEGAGYSIIMTNTYQNPERERQAINILINKRIDGIFLAAPMLTDADSLLDIARNNIPAVMVMRENTLNIDSVCTDNFGGAHTIVDYLVKTGSREIHMINLPRSSQSGTERLRGYRKAMKEHGLNADLRQVLHVAPQIADGYKGMTKLLGRGIAKGCAVFCGCDLIAIGAMEAALARGWRIPGDVRICGFDDIEMLDHLAVPLTTFRQPIPLMAKTSLNLLLERMQSASKPASTLKIPGELIIRKST